MKNIIAPALRPVVLAMALLALPVLASASDHPSSADPAVQALSVAGGVPVKSAGPYVEVGTYQIQVTVKLGRPSLTLPDGSWLYRGFAVENSQAAGTLLVRFDHGRVSDLSLISPATVTALLPASRPSPDKTLVAGLRR
jgi:hypothetical protein